MSFHRITLRKTGCLRRPIIIYGSDYNAIVINESENDKTPFSYKKISKIIYLSLSYKVATFPYFY